MSGRRRVARIVRAAQDFVHQRQAGAVVRWNLLVFVALCTGMLRGKGKWRHSDSRQTLIPKFNIAFGKILRRAGIDHGTFRDLRRTAISNWLARSLSEFEVMKLAGHSNFSTTHKFCLWVRDDMIDRARKANIRFTNGDLTRIGHASPPASDLLEKGRL